MMLRQVYIDTEKNRIEKDTKARIDKLMINPGQESPEYEERYESIMQDYRLRMQALLPLIF